MTRFPSFALAMLLEDDWYFQWQTDARGKQHPCQPGLFAWQIPYKMCLI